ncbi:MAG: hypothetical protein H7Z10_13120 [Gemmatimonadaceae bacterium]|nr:hypothetical protein [Acetobacteraceae bacterium]
MTPAAKRLAILGGLGAGMAALVGAGVLQRIPVDIGGMDRGRTEAYIGYALAAGLLYAAAIVLIRGPTLPRQAVWIVLAAALVMRLLVVTAPPLLSTDLYRYVWDGRVQAAGINPYVHLPADPALSQLRDLGTGPTAIYPNINRADYAPTIYPPAAQAIFAAIGLTWPTIWGVKAAMLGFDLLAAVVALGLLHAARRPPVHVLIYAWNPLVVWEFAGGGHIDAAAIALSACALLAAIRCRPGWAGAALAIAVLCKLLPAALFPAIWRRWNWRTPVVCGAVIVAGYACYAGAGWRVLGFLPGYATEEGIGDGAGFFVLRLAGLLGPVPRWVGSTYLAVAACGLLALAAWVSLRRPLPPDPAARAIVIGRDALWLGLAVIAALSPHYPWYFTAVAIPAVLTPMPSALWLMLSSPVLYLDHGLDEVIWPAIVFIPFVLLLARDVRRRSDPQPALAAKGS